MNPNQTHPHFGEPTTLFAVSVSLIVLLSSCTSSPTGSGRRPGLAAFRRPAVIRHPAENPSEMGNPPAAAAQRLGADETWRAAFAAAFPEFLTSLDSGSLD